MSASPQPPASRPAPRGAVVVTGASRGIGEACALRLAAAGFHVFAGVRRAADGEALRQEAGGALSPLLLDVTSAASLAAAASVVDAAVGQGGLAGLVNNAGIAVPAPLEFLPPEELRRQFEVNVVGQLAATQAFLPALRRARGRIVNMSSVSGLIASPMLGAYATSKFALEAMSDVLRLELSLWGLHVVVIEPGSVATSIWETSLGRGEAILAAAPGAAALYGPAIAAARRFARRRAAAGLRPDVVARAVEHALTAPRPKTRYLVGADARLGALVRRLPDRVRDWLLLRRYDRHWPPRARPAE
ncbi:MAG: SDR family oxidoreductase [Armatimonadota bacterium]|nr:SDR family oxidoreductase [Armatimonadota bacterium]